VGLAVPPIDIYSRQFTTFHYALEDSRIVGRGTTRESGFSQLDQLTECYYITRKKGGLG
jgi:hypothetical protein